MCWRIRKLRKANSHKFKKLFLLDRASPMRYDLRVDASYEKKILITGSAYMVLIEAVRNSQIASAAFSHSLGPARSIMPERSFLRVKINPVARIMGNHGHNDCNSVLISGVNGCVRSLA